MWTKPTLYDTIKSVIIMEITSVLISDKGIKKSFPHKHQKWEIIFNVEGCGEYIIDGHTLPFKPGTVLVCPPNIYHDKKSSQGGFQDLYINLSDSHLLTGLNLTIVEDDITGTLKELFIMAYKTFSGKDEGYIQITEKIVELILTIIVYKKDNSMNSLSTLILKNLIVENFSNPEFSCIKTLNDMPYNNDYIRRCFKRDIGMTPTEYLCKIRLNHALSLLKQDTTPRLSINEIALYSSFYDVRYFARKFRQEFGLTASEFRQEYRK